MKKWNVIAVVAALVMCVSHGARGLEDVKGGGTMRMAVTSAAFQEGGMIPRKYTCDGQDISPPLGWSPAPAGAKSIALICDDPDAPMGTWVHWVVFNLPGDASGVPEGISPRENLENGARQGVNDFGKIGYGGPCPPHGTHRYVFKIYALDAKLELSGKVTKAQLLKAIEGHILAEAQLVGKYTR